MTAPRLSDEERALLREAISRQRPDLVPLAEELIGGRHLRIDEANALRSAIGDELVKTGIDFAGDVNERGKRLDDLIDRVAERSELHD